MGMGKGDAAPPVSPTRTCTPPCLRPATPSASPADAPIAAGAQRGTPLHLAATFYGPAATERLMEKGANVNAKDRLRARPPPRRRRVAPNPFPPLLPITPPLLSLAPSYRQCQPRRFTLFLSRCHHRAHPGKTIWPGLPGTAPGPHGHRRTAHRSGVGTLVKAWAGTPTTEIHLPYLIHLPKTQQIVAELQGGRLLLSFPQLWLPQGHSS